MGKFPEERRRNRWRKGFALTVTIGNEKSGSSSWKPKEPVTFLRFPPSCVFPTPILCAKEVVKLDSWWMELGTWSRERNTSETRKQTENISKTQKFRRGEVRISCFQFQQDVHDASAQEQAVHAHSFDTLKEAGAAKVQTIWNRQESWWGCGFRSSVKF